MPIQNRDLATSEQRKEISAKLSAAVTGTTYMLGGALPYPCIVESVQVAALGLSGAPQYMFNVARFVAGVGLTTIPIGMSTLIATAFGTSGLQGWSGLYVGTSAIQLQAGDILNVTTSVANTAANDLSVEIIVKRSQDIVKHFGLST